MTPTGNPTSPSGPNNPQDLLRRAAEAFKKGRHADSEKLCRRILSLVPGQPNTLHLLGLVRFSLKDFNAASAHLETALESFPNSAELHLQLGNAYGEIGDMDRAFSFLDRALELQPGYPEALFNKARLNDTLGHLNLAEKLYSDALKQRDSYLAALLGLGNILKKSSRTSEALELYHDAVAKSPDIAVLHNNLGNLFLDTGRTAEAQQALEKAIALKPSYKDAHNNLAQLHLGNGDMQQSAKHFDLADSGYARAKAAECLAHLGRFEEVDRRMRIAAEREPSNLLMAALASYLAAVGVVENPFTFCPDPLEYVRVRQDLGGIDDCVGFVTGLKQDLSQRNELWSPQNSSTKSGYQTPDDLFDRPTGYLSELEQIIRKEIAAYRRFHSKSDSLLIRKWPETYRLRCWAVRLVKGGHQASHIHPDGWLSGVTYLDLPKDEQPPAGGIEFGLFCEAYPLLDGGEGPKRQHAPTIGDLVLFPSSLYHRTIPFDSDAERLSIAFDVVPLR